MAPLIQYNSQAKAPVMRPAYADLNAYPVSTAGAQAVRAMGEVLGQVADIELRKKKSKAIAKERYQAHLDDLKTVQANDALRVGSIEIESIMENNPPEQWENLVRAKIKDATGKAAKVNQFLSPERRDFLEQQLKSYEELEIAKMESVRLKEVKNQNLTSLLAAVQQGTAEGNDEMADLAINSLMEKWDDFFASPDDARINITSAVKRGEAESRQTRTAQITRFLEGEMTAIASEATWTDAVKWVSDPQNVKAIQEQTGADFEQIKSAAEDAKAFALAQSDEIETDEAARYGLKTMALDIWRGTTTKEKFDTALTEARFGTKIDGKRVYRFGNITSDKPLLDKQAFTALSNEAAETLKGAQAEAITRYTRDTANVILGPIASNMFTTDAQGNLMPNLAALSGEDKEQAKYMLDFVNRYEDELRLWIAENPTRSGRDLYQFAQEKKYEYWNTSLERVKEISEANKKGFKAPAVLPAPKTEDEISKLPSGTEFLAPDGTKRRKP